jgi:hypothetical protein
MDIEFNVDLTDIEAFNIYQLNHSPIAKKVWRKNILIALVSSIIMVALSVWFQSKSHVSFVASIFPVVFIVAILTYAFSLKNMTIKRELKRIRKIYLKNHSSLGKQKCTILPQSINYSNGSGEFAVKWDLFGEVINTSNYIFIVTPINNGDLIIPRNAFPDESSFNQLYTTIKKYHQDAIAKKKSTPSPFSADR